MARRMIALATALALVIAPLIVIATHGPGAHAIAAATAVDLAAEIGPHDHVDHDHHGGPVGGHNPADHDHPLQALPVQGPGAMEPDPGKARNAHAAVFRHLTPEGPRRPPRLL